MNILSNLIYTITGTPRYFPVFEWHKKNWTSNVFRFWEMIAGRPQGIKAEGAMYCSVDKYGNRTEYFIAYSWECKIAHTENLMRAYVKDYVRSVVRKIKRIQLPEFDLSVFFDAFTPEYALAGFQVIPKTKTHPKGYLFAIAVGTTNTATASGATSVTSASVTISGSNIVLMTAVGDQGGGAADILSCQASFDSTPVSMIQVDSQTVIVILATALYGLYGAVTGTIKATRTSSGDRITINSATYSGVSSSTAIGSLQKAKAAFASQDGWTSTAITVPTNGWLVMGAYVHAGGGPAFASTGTTLRIEDGEVGYLFDSNGAVSGSQSLVVDDSGAHPCGYVICAIEEYTAGASQNSNYLMRRR